MQQNDWSIVESLNDIPISKKKKTKIPTKDFLRSKSGNHFYLHSEQYANCNSMFEAHDRCFPNIYLMRDLFIILFTNQSFLAFRLNRSSSLVLFT